MASLSIQKYFKKYYPLIIENTFLENTFLEGGSNITLKETIYYKVVHFSPVQRSLNTTLAGCYLLFHILIIDNGTSGVFLSV